MSPFKREIWQIVFFNCKRTPFKSIVVMALITIGRNTIFDKLFPVIIGMAIGTSVVLYRICQTWFVACFTGNWKVFSNEFEIGFVVIEITGSLYRMKWFFCVTLPAILTEFIFMCILVTTGTIIKWKSIKFFDRFTIYNGWFMTFFAIQIHVLTDQWKFCGAVIKTCWVFKGVKSMTAVAVWRHLSLVKIIMTREAFLV